jgi:hypothetical protein
LETWQQRAGLGNSPRTLLEEFARIQSHDVILPLQAQGDPDRSSNADFVAGVYPVRVDETCWFLETRFKPRSLEAQIADTTRNRIREVMREHPIQQRPLTDYAALRAGDAHAAPQTGEAADETDPETPA